MSATDLFAARDAEGARAALRSLDEELLTRLDDHLAAGLSGSATDTRAYVGDFRRLAALVMKQAEGRCDATWAGAEPRSALDPWAAFVVVPIQSRDDWSAGDTVALNLVVQVRLLCGAPPLDGLAPGGSVLGYPAHNAPRAIGEAADRAMLTTRFQHRVLTYLAEDDADDPLLRVMRLFDLTKSDLGQLFGVRRQAIDGWLAAGVPAERQEKLSSLLALADLLERKLKAGRIPGVARRPADAYGGATMLSMIAEDRHSELLASVRESFDWSSAA